MIQLAAAALALAGSILAHHRDRQLEHPPPRHTLPPAIALASWYSDHGTGACGVGDVQSGYRFASLILNCGTRIRICHSSSCATATMSDHGPYVSGRTFDLNANLKAAIGCGDLCTVRWQVLR